MSIVQATIVDVSLENEKTKNFGLYSMAQGVGFTLGPFLGGLLAAGGYNVPFLFALVIIAGNLGIAVFFFRETHFQISPQKIHWNMGLVQLKKAFRLTHIRTILFSSFLHNFAWSFFFEFIPVYLISRYLFTATDLGFFYAVAGGFYALSTGLLIRPFIARFKPEGLFFAGNVATAIVIFAMLLIPSSLWIWPLLILMCYVVAFVTPTSTTIVSNSASSKIQGEALGILGSVNSAALVLSPLFSGSIVGAYPELTMWVGSCMMIIAALIVFAAYGRRLFSRE
jgi:DHA1 family tetracycline resistance protein-like MFS transporter